MNAHPPKLLSSPGLSWEESCMSVFDNRTIHYGMLCAALGKLPSPHLRQTFWRAAELIQMDHDADDYEVQLALVCDCLVQHHDNLQRAPTGLELSQIVFDLTPTFPHYL